jgi:hypothetical protein
VDKLKERGRARDAWVGQRFVGLTAGPWQSHQRETRRQQGGRVQRGSPLNQMERSEYTTHRSSTLTGSSIVV